MQIRAISSLLRSEVQANRLHPSLNTTGSRKIMKGLPTNPTLCQKQESQSVPEKLLILRILQAESKVKSSEFVRCHPCEFAVKDIQKKLIGIKNLNDWMTSLISWRTRFIRNFPSGSAISRFPVVSSNLIAALPRCGFLFFVVGNSSQRQILLVGV